MKKRFLGIICLIYVALILYVKLTGNLGNYLAPQMQKYIIWSVIPLLIIGLVICLNNHISSKFKFTDIILLLPIVMIILAGDGRLTATLASNRNALYKNINNEITSNNKKKEVREKSKNGTTKSEKSNKQNIITSNPKYDFSTVDYDIVNESYSMLSGIITYPDMYGYDPNHFIGKKIRVKGFALTSGVQYIPTGYFAIGKYIINCCAADAGFGGFYVKYNTEKIEKNTWYEIEGILEKMDDTNSYATLAINIVNIKKINGEKEEQYAYPCYSYGDGNCSIIKDYDLGESKYEIQSQ